MIPTKYKMLFCMKRLNLSSNHMSDLVPSSNFWALACLILLVECDSSVSSVAPTEVPGDHPAEQR